MLLWKVGESTSMSSDVTLCLLSTASSSTGASLIVLLTSKGFTGEEDETRGEEGVLITGKKAPGEVGGEKEGE